MVFSNPVLAERQVCRWVDAGLHVAVVVPCYNVQAHISGVVESMPGYIHSIILVNDASRDATGLQIENLKSRDDRIHTLHLKVNRGVGNAVMAGFSRALELGADVVVKMDGDGQMDPQYLPLLIKPLVLGEADYAKGNRFAVTGSLSQMPTLRRMGNAGLSFLTRAASGYWNILDPNNGYVAARSEIVKILPSEIIHSRFFFESSMLIALNILGAVVLDIPMNARYGTEKSNLQIRRVALEIPFLLAWGFLRRIWSRKILYNLTMEAILGTCGLVLALVGFAFGAVEFVNYALIKNTAAPAGTVMTAALPVLLGFQMLMNAILLDIQSVPSTPLCERIYVPGNRADKRM